MPLDMNLFPEHRKKETRKPEYAGPCPWCGGDDRFVILPEAGRSGRFFCRQCAAKGDGIDLLRKTKNYSFREACEVTGGDKEPNNVETKKPTKPTVDRLQWESRGLSLLKFSMESVNSDWAETLARKNLTQETARAFQLGWISETFYDESKDWGLDGEKMLLPAGLVIPAFLDGKLSSIKIRLSSPHGKHRYHQVRGGQNHQLTIKGSNDTIIVVESELDAILISQETKDRYGVIALGGASNALSPRAVDLLNRSKTVLISTDFDHIESDVFGAGQTAAKRLQHMFENAEIYPVAIGKDPCEMQQNGISVSLWLKAYELEALRVRIPDSYVGDATLLAEQLCTYRHMISCPITSPRPWLWRERTTCQKCKGHIDCIKGLSLP